MRLSLYHLLSRRYFQQRWPRAVLVVMSITLGVATLVATRALNQSMETASHTSARPLDGQADLIVSNGDAGVSLDLADDIVREGEQFGVRSVLPLLIEPVVLPDLDRPAKLIGVPIDKLKNLGDNPWGLTWDINWREAWKHRDNFIFVGKHMTGDLERKITGDDATFRMRARGVTHELPHWVGWVEASGASSALGSNVIYMDARQAAKLLGQPGKVTLLNVMLESGADREQARERIAALVGNRGGVRTPQEFDKLHSDPMSGLQVGFSFCGAGALVVGLFLVYNVLSVSVAERRHEIGILRSLGATRPQIGLLFLGEAGILGLAGAALGIPLGLGLAQLGLGPMQRVFSELFAAMEAPKIVLGNDTLALAAAAGIVTALLAAWIPARKAAREEPASAVRRRPPATDLAHRVVQVSTGGGLIGTGLLCMLLRHQLPARLGNYLCLALAVLGMLLLTPLLAVFLANLLRPTVRRLFGIETRLAADNLVRAPGRTGLVITALAAGVGMVFQTAGVIRSNQAVVLGWLDQTMLADLYVTSGSPVSGSSLEQPLPDTVGAQLAATDPGIAGVLAERFHHTVFRGREIFLIALDAAHYVEAAGRAGRPVPGRKLFAHLTEPGTPRAIVSENFAALYHVHAGDSIELPGPDGAVTFEVIGTVEDYSWNQGTVIVDRGVYRECFHDSLVNVFNVFLKPDADAGAVREQLARRWGVEYNLVILTRRELRTHIESVIQRIYQIAYSQEVVVGIVAALGVVSALLISVLQRRSELGVLRALGATRAQVLQSVLAEAALMGVLGVVIGLVVGLPIEWYILRVILLEEAGFSFAVSIPWQEGGVIAGLAVLVATLAGLVPALHTLRLRIPEAIAYE